MYVSDIAHDALAQQNIRPTSVLVTAAPFNSILWRVLAVDRDYYYEGVYSLRDGGHLPEFSRHPRQLSLISDIEESWPVQRLKWFSKDFFAVSDINGAVAVSDLRMGLEPDYVFRFKVGARQNGRTTEVPVERLPAQRNMSRLPGLWERI